MHQLNCNKKAVSNIIFIGFVAALIVICLAVSFVEYYRINSLQQENSLLQQNITNLQSSSDQLKTAYDQVSSLYQQLFPVQNTTASSVNNFSVAPSSKLIIIHAEAVSKLGEAKIWCQNLNAEPVYITAMLLEDVSSNRLYNLTLIGDNLKNATYIGSNGISYVQSAISIDFGQTAICIGTGSFYHEPNELPFIGRITLITNLGNFDTLGFVQSMDFPVNV